MTAPVEQPPVGEDVPIEQQLALAYSRHRQNNYLGSYSDYTSELMAIITAAERRGAERMRETCAAKATGFLVGDPANGVPLRNPMAHEIATAIRAIETGGEALDTQARDGRGR